MHFDPSYFKEEEREGFVIKPMIKKAWAAQLEVLAEIDKICKRHNIQYYAEYGTLLGAVRHQGFIPWDDDMDIGMLRKDFARFQHYAREELPEPFKLLSIHNRNHKKSISRVINGYNIDTGAERMERFHGCPFVIGVDIFISDNIPLNKEEEELQLELFAIASTLANEWEKQDMTDADREDCLRQIEELCHVELSREDSMVPQLFELSDKISAMYWDIDAREVTFMNKLYQYSEYRLPASCFEMTVEVPFDVTTIPIPIGYHNVLSRRYGPNYMTPRYYSDHGYPFFKDQQEILIEEFKERGLDIPDWLKDEFEEVK